MYLCIRIYLRKLLDAGKFRHILIDFPVIGYTRKIAHIGIRADFVLLIVIIGILIPELRDNLLSVHFVNIQNTFLLSDIPELRHGKRIDIN